MAKEISRTMHGDAPLSAAKHPDPEALEEAAGAQSGDAVVGRTVTINRPRTELYAFWRNFDNLPRFMENVVSVTPDGDGRSHWVVLGPADRTVEWDAQILEDIPDERISWAAVEPASVRNSGSVEFRDSANGRGTLVSVVFAYDPPGGTIGTALATLFGRNPKFQARQDLRRFKQLMETGEVSTAKPPYAAPRA
jgi:uncharacterized membrane protein